MLLLLLVVVAGACNSLMSVGSKAAKKSSEYVESYRQHDSFRQNPRDPSRPNSGDGARQRDVPDAAGSRRVTKMESHGFPEEGDRRVHRRQARQGQGERRRAAQGARRQRRHPDPRRLRGYLAQRLPGKCSSPTRPPPAALINQSNPCTRLTRTSNLESYYQLSTLLLCNGNC